MTPRPKPHNTRLGRSVVFLGSVRFAVPILAITAGALIYGTWVESTLGPTQARSAVYGSWWFLALMASICISLTLSVVTRFPWRKEHAGFIIVHASLIVIILSGFLSYFMRAEGTFTLTEGKSTQAPTNQRSPFTIELIDFRTAHYPGSNMPMAHESDVILTDAQGHSFTKTISMNNPLKHNGSKVYLTGFTSSESAIFKVTSDPGLLPMYAGCLTLCLGILVMNYSKSSPTNHPTTEELPCAG